MSLRGEEGRRGRNRPDVTIKPGFLCAPNATILPIHYVSRSHLMRLSFFSYILSPFHQTLYVSFHPTPSEST